VFWKFISLFREHSYRHFYVLQIIILARRYLTMRLFLKNLKYLKSVTCFLLGQIFGSHGDESELYCLLVCCAVQSGRNFTDFWEVLTALKMDSVSTFETPSVSIILYGSVPKKTFVSPVPITHRLYSQPTAFVPGLGTEWLSRACDVTSSRAYLFFLFLYQR
jgi:hypothetical protein